MLEIKNINKSYRVGDFEQKVLKDVSIKFRKSEFVAILGHSGSGKTTLVRMITRLLPSTYGEIILNGEDITHIKGRKLRNIYSNMQMVFQSPYDSFDGRHKFGRSMIEPMINNGFSKADAMRGGI